jgi:hypothetical protein
MLAPTWMPYNQVWSRSGIAGVMRDEVVVSDVVDDARAVNRASMPFG